MNGYARILGWTRRRKTNLAGSALVVLSKKMPSLSIRTLLFYNRELYNYLAFAKRLETTEETLILRGFPSTIALSSIHG